MTVLNFPEDAKVEHGPDGSVTYLLPVGTVWNVPAGVIGADGRIILRNFFPHPASEGPELATVVQKKPKPRPYYQRGRW